jgi:hypothetical protein
MSNLAAMDLFLLHFRAFPTLVKIKVSLYLPLASLKHCCVQKRPYSARKAAVASQYDTEQSQIYDSLQTTHQNLPFAN